MQYIKCSPVPYITQAIISKQEEHIQNIQQLEMLTSQRHLPWFNFARLSRELVTLYSTHCVTAHHVTEQRARTAVLRKRHKSNMATRAVSKIVHSSRARFVYGNSLRVLIVRPSSSEAPSITDDGSRISFVTNGCSLEELQNVQDLVCGDLEIHDNFISEKEETAIMEEIEPCLKRLKYEYDHWDDVSGNSRRDFLSSKEDNCISKDQ